MKTIEQHFEGILSPELLAKCVERYNSNGLAYHNIENHILPMLNLWDRFFEDYPDTIPNKDWIRAVKIATLYHDIVYDPKRNDNEEQSANVFLSDNAQLALVNSHFEELVLWCIVYSKEKIEKFIFPKLDLPTYAKIGMDGLMSGFAGQFRILDRHTLFSGSFKELEANERLIRQEYSHLTLQDYLRGRIFFLREYEAHPPVKTLINNLLHELALTNH